MLKKKIRLALPIALALTLFVVIIALAATVKIDGFTDGADTLFVNVGSSGSKVTDTTGDAIGDERDVYATASGSAGAFLYTQVNTSGNGTFSYNAGSGVSGYVQVEWDGNDNTANSIAYTGLGGVDLTDGGSNDSIHIVSISADADSVITFTIYTTSTAYSIQSITIPGDISGTVDFILPFSSFIQGGTSPAVFTNTGAIVMNIDAPIQDTDLTVDLFQADSTRDFGDLPSGYPVASHIPQGLRLGMNVDTEASSQSGTPATGDDNLDADDEDGVTRDPSTNWGAGNIVKLNVTVNGCSGTCYLNGWVDGNSNNSFADSGEQVLSDYSISNGDNQSVSITLPSSGTYTNQSKYARFRICDASGECNTVSATNVTNGEVEDYKWEFGPTAITLNTLTASSNLPIIWLVVGIAVLLFIAGITWLVLSNRRVQS